MCNERSRRSGGFSLIEMILFIVIVGAGVAGVMSVYSIVVKHSADPVEPKQALMLAEARMEQVLLQEYAAIASAPYAAPTDVTGAALGLSGYEVKVDVTPTAAAIDAGSSAGRAVIAAGDAKRIVVSVKGPIGTYSLTGYRLNYE